VRYFSKSRGEFIEIDSMPTRHLSNAAKKLVPIVADFLSDDPSQASLDFDESCGRPDDVLSAMIDELASRVPAKDSVPS